MKETLRKATALLAAVFMLMSLLSGAAFAEEEILPGAPDGGALASDTDAGGSEAQPAPAPAQQAVAITIAASAFGDTALRLPGGVAISESGLLAGVSAEDETGAAVAAAIADVGGLALDNPQPKGAPGDPQPYIITYEAEHPVSGEVFTAAREVYITVAARPLAYEFSTGGSNYASLEAAAAAVAPGGTITLNGSGTIDAPGDIVLDVDKAYTIDFGGYTITASENCSIAIEAGSVRLMNGAYTATYPGCIGVYVTGGSAILEDFDVSVTGAGSQAVHVEGSGATMRIVGGSFTSGREAVYCGNSGRAVITSGSFESTLTAACFWQENSGEITLSQGSTANVPDILNAPIVNVTMSNNFEDNNGNVYGSLADAILGVAAGGTITMLNDVALESSLTTDKNFTLDLGGYTLSNGADLDWLLHIDSGNVTIQNGEIHNDYWNAIEIDGGDVTLSDLKVTADGLEDISVSGVDVGAVIVISGTCEIISGEYYGTSAAVISYGTTTITAGTFDSSPTGTNTGYYNRCLVAFGGSIGLNPSSIASADPYLGVPGLIHVDIGPALLGTAQLSVDGVPWVVNGAVTQYSGGGATFNPVTRELTLDGYGGGQIVAANMDVNIVLVGDNNNVSHTVDAEPVIQLSEGNLTISGSGTLNIGHVGGVDNPAGIGVNNGDVNIDGGTVNITVGPNTDMGVGILTDGDVNIDVNNGAKLTIDMAAGAETHAIGIFGGEITIIGTPIIKAGESAATAQVIGALPDDAVIPPDESGAAYYFSIEPTFAAAPAQQRAASDAKKSTPPPVVAVLYDAAKTGDAFTFKIILMNGRNNMAGTTVTVKLNEKYATTVTIGQDGVGHGTIEAPGFSGNIANFSTQPHAPGAGSVTTAYIVYSTGEVVRR